jgi:hypothetical protein
MPAKSRSKNRRSSVVRRAAILTAAALSIVNMFH